MGCGCKKKPEEPKTEVITLNGVTEIMDPQEPPYTREELNRALNYVNGVTTSAEERRFTINFHNQHSQEQLVPSCTTCWSRVKTRMDNMNQKLTFYEQFKSRRQTENNSQ